MAQYIIEQEKSIHVEKDELLVTLKSDTIHEKMYNYKEHVLNIIASIAIISLLCYLILFLRRDINEII